TVSAYVDDEPLRVCLPIAEANGNDDRLISEDLWDTCHLRECPDGRRRRELDDAPRAPTVHSLVQQAAACAHAEGMSPIDEADRPVERRISYQPPRRAAVGRRVKPRLRRLAKQREALTSIQEAQLRPAADHAFPWSH